MLIFLLGVNSVNNGNNFHIFDCLQPHMWPHMTAHLLSNLASACHIYKWGDKVFSTYTEQYSYDQGWVSSAVFEVTRWNKRNNLVYLLSNGRATARFYSSSWNFPNFTET